MAADDEEDDWGFTFAVSNQSHNDDDDDWGDFVNSSNQSSTTTTLPNNQKSSEVGSDDKTKLKRGGRALPLSLFGEKDEDDDDGKAFNDNKTSGDLGNQHVKSCNDIIIANLYEQQNKVNDENGVDGSRLDVNNLDLGGATEKENGLVLNSVSKKYGSDFAFGGLHFEFDGSKMTSNVTSDGVMSDSVMGLGGLNWTSAARNDQDMKIDKGNLSSNVQDSNFAGQDSNFSGLDSNGKSSNFGGWDSNFGGLDSNVEAAAADDEFDGDDDDGWEFKDAYSESKVEKGNDKENIGLEFPEFDFKSQTNIGKEMQNVSQDQIDLFSMSDGISGKSHDTQTKFDLKPQSVQKDVRNGLKSQPLAENAESGKKIGDFFHFATSNGFSSKSHDMDIESDCKPVAEVQNAFGSDSYLQYTHTDLKNELNSDPVAESADFDESFEEFKDAAPNSGLKQEEIEMTKENHKGPVPLSIFGIEEPETDASLDMQDDFMSKLAHSGNGHSRPPSLSINDILTNLYSQSELTPINSEHKPTNDELGLSNVIPNSDDVDGDQDFEDGSWEFKDAASQISVDEEASLGNAIDAGQSYSSEAKMNTYSDFYLNLNDELRLVCRFHLKRLKEARNTVALSGDGSKLAALDEEIQDASNELFHNDILYKEDEEDYPLEISLQKFLEVLHGNKFQALDSEYELSRKLGLAEKELKSAMKLIKHSMEMVKILTLISTEEQSSYISTWFKMLSVCTRELQHGFWILKQSFERNVQSQILSEPQGRRFILALGEVYRVVLVLGASVKLYKPWILSNSVDSTSISALLEECHNLWSCSGLEEALQSIADLETEYYGSVQGLLASIKNIRDVDVLKFNHPHDQQEYVCVLSGLTQGLVPDIKMVFWNGEHYFLTLANLWANLISYDPPMLTRIKVG